MTLRILKASLDDDDNSLRFVRPSAQDCGAKALDLVYQAAEVFRSMEDHAQEIEARAKSMCKSAAEKLKHAEKRIETAERVRREIVTEADCRLQDAST